MLLSDEEILHRVDTHVGEPNQKYPLNGSDWKNFARAIEAAILAKLASAELPEPLSMGSSVAGVFLDVYLPVHLQKAHAQGFAAGAAAQLSAKPSAFQLRDEEASEHYGREIYVLYSVFDFKDGANIGNIEKVLTPLYTRREA